MPPRSRIPKPVHGDQRHFQFPDTQLSYDLPAFDNLLRNNGVKIKHFRAIPDPRGLNDRGDIRRDYPVSSVDNMIYKEAGCFTAIFTSNDKMPVFEVEGEIDQSSVYMTPPRFYDNTEEPVIIDTSDRFELQDIELRVVTRQLITANDLGRDRLHYPAVCVEILIGSDGFEYKEDVHFKIDLNGDIQWITNQRPGTNSVTGKGEIYAIRYRYIPFYVVRRLLHEIRVSQVTDMMTGIRRTERLPYQVQLARENVFRDIRRNSEAPVNDPRFQDIPQDGNLKGPRGS